MSTKRIFYMKAFNLVLTGLLLGIIVWLLVTLILGVIYQPEYSNDIKVTVNFNNKPVEGTETVETTRQVPVTCPFSGETKTSEVKTVVKKTKSEPSERKVVVTEDAFKETMQQVAYTARQEAQNEYDKNFATLLTILTIFGIAWPVIIALLQFKFNESDLKEIKNDLIKANKTLSKANGIQKEFVTNNIMLWNNLKISLDFISLSIKDIEMICMLRISTLNCVVNKLKLDNQNSELYWQEILSDVKLIKTNACTKNFAKTASCMLSAIQFKIIQIEADNPSENNIKTQVIEKIDKKRLELEVIAENSYETKNL